MPIRKPVTSAAAEKLDQRKLSNKEALLEERKGGMIDRSTSFGIAREQTHKAADNEQKRSMMNRLDEAFSSTDNNFAKNHTEGLTDYLRNGAVNANHMQAIEQVMKECPQAADTLLKVLSNLHREIGSEKFHKLSSDDVYKLLSASAAEAVASGRYDELCPTRIGKRLRVKAEKGDFGNILGKSDFVIDRQEKKLEQVIENRVEVTANSLQIARNDNSREPLGQLETVDRTNAQQPTEIAQIHRQQELAQVIPIETQRKEVFRPIETIMREIVQNRTVANDNAVNMQQKNAKNEARITSEEKLPNVATTIHAPSAKTIFLDDRKRPDEKHSNHTSKEKQSKIDETSKKPRATKNKKRKPMARDSAEKILYKEPELETRRRVKNKIETKKANTNAEPKQKAKKTQKQTKELTTSKKRPQKNKSIVQKEMLRRNEPKNRAAKNRNEANKPVRKTRPNRQAQKIERNELKQKKKTVSKSKKPALKIDNHTTKVRTTKRTDNVKTTEPKTTKKLKRSEKNKRRKQAKGSKQFQSVIDQKKRLERMRMMRRRRLSKNRKITLMLLLEKKRKARKNASLKMAV